MPDKNTELRFAIMDNDITAVNTAINKGADPNASLPSLHCATFFTTSNEILDSLIKAGADVKTKDSLGETALHAAAAKGNYRTAEYLIKHGADVNVVDKYGMTPLHVVLDSEYGNLATTELLLKHGANIEASDDHYRRPLHFAADMDIDAVGFLLEHGAKPNVFDERGGTPLHIAASGNPDSVELLLKHGADAKAKDRWGLEATYYAAYNGYTEAAQALIEHGGSKRDNDLGVRERVTHDPKMSAIISDMQSEKRPLQRSSSVPDLRATNNKKSGWNR